MAFLVGADADVIAHSGLRSNAAEAMTQKSVAAAVAESAAARGSQAAVFEKVPCCTPVFEPQVCLTAMQVIESDPVTISAAVVAILAASFLLS